MDRVAVYTGKVLMGAFGAQYVGCQWLRIMCLGGVALMLMMSWGASGCAKNGIRAPRVHFLAYFTAQTQKKTRKDTTNLECVAVFPECVPKCFLLWFD